TVPPTATTGLVVVMVNGLPSNGVIFTVEADGSICPAASEQTLQGGALNQGESFQLPFTMQPCETATFAVRAVPAAPATGVSVGFSVRNEASFALSSATWATFGGGDVVTNPRDGIGPPYRGTRGVEGRPASMDLLVLASSLASYTITV